MKEGDEFYFFAGWYVSRVVSNH